MSDEDVEALAAWPAARAAAPANVAFMPYRVLMQDFTGVPATVDLAAMRSAMARADGDPARVNPLIPVDLMIDHSVQVDLFGLREAYQANIEWEYRRNTERYQLLRWAQQAFDGFRVVPPGMGICHQVNLEHLGPRRPGPGRRRDARHAARDRLAHDDDQRARRCWAGASAASRPRPRCSASRCSCPGRSCSACARPARSRPGTTATDLVLTLTEMLRAHGVVGKFVEFYGDGLSSLTVEDRATLSNMCPEYGATASFFPCDEQTLRYLRTTNRGDVVDLVERYTKEQGLFRTDADPDPVFSETLELDLVGGRAVDGRPAPAAGPRGAAGRLGVVRRGVPRSGCGAPAADPARQPDDDRGYEGLGTNCPDERLHEDVRAAGARRTPARWSTTVGRDRRDHVVHEHVEPVRHDRRRAAGEEGGGGGPASKPWVKTSLAPGSRVVTDYLDRAGLQPYLDKLGFELVGYGCTTCIGNSGPLPEPVAKAVDDRDLAVVAVLSGNRNFEGRIHPQVRASYLASPLLCVAYALAGRSTST